jgi:hypothetical protein
MSESPWRRSWRADPRGAAIADRHYNRQRVGAPQFVPPGACLVLLTEDRSALWVTSSWWRRRKQERACGRATNHCWHPVGPMTGWFCCMCSADIEGMPPHKCTHCAHYVREVTP